MKAENPKDIFNAFRDNELKSSFHVRAEFSREDGNEKNGKPLKAFNHFSRLVVTIIDNKKPIFVEANIQYEKLEKFIETGRIAAREYIMKNLFITEETGENTSPAYTYVIPAGKLAGKTPAQILQEPNGSKKLNDQYQWLSDNLEKYPKNKEQMDAIMDAARLQKEGKLEKQEKSSIRGIMPILEAVPLPLIRKKKEDGTCPVREIEINCNFSKNAPFEVTITNYDAPVVAISKDGAKEVTTEGSGGNKINVKKKEKKNEVIKKFNLTDEEFLSWLDHIEVAKTIFLNNNSPVLYKEALEAEMENRKNSAKKNTDEDQPQLIGA